MDQQQQQRINEAADKFTSALVESYRTVSDRAVSPQEQGAQLTQQFFNSVIDNLRTQAEETRTSSQELTEQARRGQVATQELAQASMNAYMKLMDDMFSYYRLLIASRSKRL